MDLAAICQVLAATQNATDEVTRKAAEQKIAEATENAPDQLVQALVAVLAAGGNVAPELRQQAAVLVRQRVQNDWDNLQEITQKGLKLQLLATVENDDVPLVRRNAGSVIAGVARTAFEEASESSLDQLMQRWPELLPWLAQFSVTGSNHVRSTALRVLKDLAEHIGEEMLKRGDQVSVLLEKALSDPAPEIRAAGAQLVLAFVQWLDDDAHTKVAIAMPAVTSVLQGLATSSTEKELEETLGALVAAIEEEPAFFFENAFQPLWTTLMTICNADAVTFGIPEIRHLAMEAMMTIAEGCNDEEEFKGCLEGMVEVNFRWMLEVEKDVAAWTAEGKDTGEDGEIDNDVVRIGEENFDRLGTSFDEDDLMPIVFKVLAAKIANVQTCDWTEVRSAVMAVSQVVEHLEDDARIDQCIEFISRFFEHPHPRVRYVAFSAIAQSVFDQTERLHEKYAAELLAKLLKGMQDDNVRVVTSAVEAFSALATDMDAGDVGLEDHMEELLLILFKHLGAGESTHLQEQCVESISGAAESADTDFAKYYEQVMPLLKQVIEAASAEGQRNLRGKAFLCTSNIGKAVGKELFLKDACEVMGVMVPLFQAGFAADDKTREFVHEACGNIAEVIGKEFKCYTAALLPTILQVLNQTPKDITELLEEEDDLDEIILNDLGALGLKTSVLEEMDEALELVITLVKSLEEEYCEFIGPSCQALLPLLDYPMSEDVRETIYRAWGHLAALARTGAEKGRMDPTILRGLVTEFLKKTVGFMAQGSPEDVCENNVTTCVKIHTLAVGAADIIQKAGPGVLTREAMTDVSKVILTLLGQIVCSGEASVEGKKHKKKRDPESIDDDGDDSDDDDDPTPTPQAVRFALADVVSALMQTNKEEFAEDVLPTLMQQLVQKYVQENSNSADRAIAFYIANLVTDFMGEGGVKYWQIFMNQALVAVLDKSPIVQRYATKVVGSGTKQKQYSVMALAACQNVYQVLQKHGEKHKRRRVKADKAPIALAIDACVRALGLICEHQEQQLGQHAPQIWSMWISSLPIKYDVEAGQQVHAQLLGLLAREHPMLLDQTRLPAVLRILTDVYKTKFSTPDLDKSIAFAMAQIGVEKLEVLCSDFKEGQKKKTQQMLKTVKAVGGG